MTRARVRGVPGGKAGGFGPLLQVWIRCRKPGARASTRPAGFWRWLRCRPTWARDPDLYQQLDSALSPHDRGRDGPAADGLVLRWSSFAITHHLNPLVRSAVNVPDGVNLIWNTALPLPCALLAPITLQLGRVFAYNLAG